MGARTPDLILVEKRGNHGPSSMLLYQVIVGYVRNKSKRLKNISLKRQLERLCWLKKVEVVPVIVGALRCISKGFSGLMDTLGIKLGTARILGKVLDM